MRTSDQGIALLKKHEGLRLTAYPDPASGGEPWTIGYGTTSRAGVGKVTRGMKISQAQAEDMLRRSLVGYEQGVLKAITRTPTQNQFDAMVSLAYNIGVGAMSKSSVIRHFNANDDVKAGGAFLLWNKAAGKVMPGLTRRRAEERALFLKPSAPISKNPPAAATPIAEQAPEKKPETVAQEPAKEPAKPGATIAGWVLGILVALIAAAAAIIAKGS